MSKYNKGNNDEYLLQNNLLGVDKQDDLTQAEALSFFVRNAEIEKGIYTIKGFSKRDFMAIHHHLFQDIYPFAGKFRDVNLSKGATVFCQFQFLDACADSLFKELKIEGNWKTVEIAAKRLAYFKAELNMLHPFREGNGRTIRIFLAAYAKEKGYMWRYENMDTQVYLEAMIKSKQDESDLEKLLLTVLEPL